MHWARRANSRSEIPVNLENIMDPLITKLSICKNCGDLTVSGEKVCKMKSV